MKDFELQPYQVSNETLSLIDKADSSIKMIFITGALFNY